MYRRLCLFDSTLSLYIFKLRRWSLLFLIKHIPYQLKKTFQKQIILSNLYFKQLILLIFFT